jgi:DNA-binding MarR family transcriptional regulator
MSQGEPGIVLDTSLGYMLKAAASALHSALEAVLRPLGMTITHYACLELLAQRPGLSNSELARGAFVTRQSMNVLLQALERQGLVVRPAQAPVGRGLPTELTARGRRQLTVASAAVRRVEQDMLANLDTGDQDQMRRLLTTCIAALTEPPNRRDDSSGPTAGSGHLAQAATGLVARGLAYGRREDRPCPQIITAVESPGSTVTGRGSAQSGPGARWTNHLQTPQVKTPIHDFAVAVGL